jgi:phosphonopyruvate decarboxylase
VTTGLLRTEAVAIVAAARKDMLSLCTMQAVDPWNSAGQADARNFNVVGCMGSVASVALGLALGRPQDRVLAIDGDGSLLMQLGSLVSIGEVRPTNLYHVVFENGSYETSGGQTVPGHGVADLTAIARASGYRHTVRFSSAAELESDIDRVLELEGPVFISLTIAGPGDCPPAMEPVLRKVGQIARMREELLASAPSLHTADRAGR